MLAARLFGRTIAAVALLGLAGGAAVAQNAPTVALRVHVADSLGNPIAGAEVSVVRGLATVVARGATDASGANVLVIPRAGADNELVVRKIGFARFGRFFNDSSSSNFDVRLHRTAQALDTIKVAAPEDVRRKSYFIDAETIEASSRPVVDALDVVTKLRPDMIWGRLGQPDRIGQHAGSNGRYVTRAPWQTIRAATAYGYCPPVSSIWVNGQRQRLISTDPHAVNRLTGDARFISPLIATVLASIKPEHVDEMEYHPCTETTADTPVNSTNAIFITLKPGVVFEPGVGSLVMATPSSAARGLPVRLIGVFDEATGAVIEGADVVDVSNGSFMRTSVTGTATLGFLSRDATAIRIQKAGYEPLTIAVSPDDTAPLTVVLTPEKRGAPRPPHRLRAVGA